MPKPDKVTVWQSAKEVEFTVVLKKKPPLTLVLRAELCALKMHMLRPQYLENTTVFGDWVFKEIMKLNCDHEGEP